MLLIEGLDHITLGCSNLKQTIMFYEMLFDFEVVENTENSVTLVREPYKLYFQHVLNFTPLTKNPGYFSLAFSMEMDDFTRAIKELEDRKVEIITGPLAIEGGESLIIADPDGHLIELFYRE